MDLDWQTFVTQKLLRALSARLAPLLGLAPRRPTPPVRAASRATLCGWPARQPGSPGLNDNTPGRPSA